MTSMGYLTAEGGSDFGVRGTDEGRGREKFVGALVMTDWGIRTVEESSGKAECQPLENETRSSTSEEKNNTQQHA